PHLTTLSSRFFFSMRPPPPTSTLFPYTTLFRSLNTARAARQWAQGDEEFNNVWLSLEAQLGNRKMVIEQRERIARQAPDDRDNQDRKSTRLNSSHSQISYAVFCLKKKKKKKNKK